MATSFRGFQSLIEHSPDAISLIDRRGEILYGSASTAQNFGYDPEDLIGRNCLDLMHPEDRGHSILALEQVLAQPPGPFQWDVRIRHKDGNYRWFENTISNLLLESEVQAIVMHQRNIDARRAVEIERLRCAEDLARSNARLEEFAFTAAHDLREPLRAISYFSELLLAETEMNASGRQMAEFIVKGAMRMSTVIDDLLSFASTGVRAALRQVDLRVAAEQAVANLALEIEASGAKVTLDTLPVVYGVEIHLVRLFQNLIGNAVKYRGANPPEIRVACKQVGANWIVRVEDNGLGIARKDQDRIFEPFVRLGDGRSPGTGLGLSVSRKIADSMGGMLRVDSEPGIGSVFSFSVPVALELPHAMEAGIGPRMTDS